MIEHTLLEDEKILIVTPKGALEKNDFEKLSAIVDPYLENEGQLNGLMIQTESFPGWDNFAALISHFQFVKNHQKKILRVAAVTDSGFLSVMPVIADHFIDAEIKHFNYDDKERAMEWLKETASS
jgi:hypothetical protein